MSTLDELGQRHKELVRELDELKPKLHAAMLAERFNADGTPKNTQNNIRDRSGYKTVQQVRVITGEAPASTSRSTAAER